MKAQAPHNNSMHFASGSQQQLQAAQQEGEEWETVVEKRRKEEKRERKCDGQEKVGAQEGKKEEVEKEDEERGGEQVKKDATDWVEVRRRTTGKSRKMVQIFVKVNGSKVTPMEVNMTDDKVEDIMRQVQKDEDVYVTMQGNVLKTSEKLKRCGVTEGCTIQVTSRMRGGGKHREKKSKIEKERSGSPKKIEQAQGQKTEVEPSLNVDEMYVLMEEQMRLMSEEAKSLQVTDEVVQRIVEHVVRMGADG